MTARAWLGRSWFLIPLAVFAISRAIDSFLLVLLGHEQYALGPTMGFDVGFSVADRPASPGYADLVTNWDGQWYRSIAESGYPSELPRYDGEVSQNAWAFYPAFPYLVRAVMALTTLPYGLAASLVSLTAAAAATCLVWRLVERAGGPFVALTVVLGLCFHPAAPVFLAAYTEGLALLSIALVLTGVQRRWYAVSGVGVLLLALTRPIVLVLAPVFLWHLIRRWRSADDPAGRREKVQVVALLVGSVVSFALWPVIAWWRTGERNAYLETQKAWILDDSRWSSWVASAFTGDNRELTVWVIVAVVALAVLLLRRSARLWSAELRVWAGCYAVYLLCTVRPTSSIIRYSILGVIPVWPAPEIGTTRMPSRAIRVGIVLILCVAGVIAHYYWLKWYFVVAPGAKAYP